MICSIDRSPNFYDHLLCFRRKQKALALMTMNPLSKNRHLQQPNGGEEEQLVLLSFLRKMLPLTLKRFGTQYALLLENICYDWSFSMEFTMILI